MYKAILFDLDGTLTESARYHEVCSSMHWERINDPEADLEN